MVVGIIHKSLQVGVILLIINVYCQQMKFPKVMFLHLSAILFTGGRCLPQCMLGCTPWEQTPLGGDNSPRADTPWEQTPPRADTHREQTPPRADTPHGADTPSTVHAGRYRQQAGGSHPTGMYTCFIIEYSETFRENSNKTRNYANSIRRVRSIVTIHLSASAVLI